ncbi:hypothetical protein [Hymenobacter jeollabukensis]|uniref:Fibronectin type III domain-containing protein n=1 Tax=Hymenobacter jeollabukensis TaxID=2025313 RepID=A0A5R8WN03_9BACT|nr:hypothetical protein [Hymenobacter jeollabukensis]TLM90628.1 hypothetical protein FDY95_18145 [Hymenobacter jeollabukensis]
MTRRFILSLLFTLLLAASAAWAVTLTVFQATLDGASVRVEWEVLNENGLTNFELYRKGATDVSFDRISVVVPTGQRRYQYLDANLYRGTTSTASTNSGPYTYRLQVKTSTGDQVYTTMLSQTPSAVQRSWGSIKSMFR